MHIKIFFLNSLTLKCILSHTHTENLKKLVKGSSDENGLSCINGIKACAMLFILGGHALVFMLGGPVQNAEFFESASKKIQNAFLLNSPLLVDLFLLLSGFLFARLLLLELDKRNGKVNFLVLYIFRYIRYDLFTCFLCVCYCSKRVKL